MYYAISLKEQEEYFLNQPETGMGYQVINASKLGTITKHKYIILNSQIAIDFDADYGKNIKNVITEGILKIQMSSQKIAFSSNTIKVYSEKEFRNIVNETKVPTERAAIENPKQSADGIEDFVRLSAFLDDKRVDKINNRLRPGSFSTTKKDYLQCKQLNQDPIIRYALPNEEKIEWAFYIKPRKGDIFQKGKVQPANGKIGGGEEAYFELGTSTGTFIAEGKY